MINVKHLFIYGSAAIAFGISNIAMAQCTPDWRPWSQSVNSCTSGSGTVSDSYTYRIGFPDGYTYDAMVTGSAACATSSNCCPANQQQTVKCPASFSAVTTSNGYWAKTVQNGTADVERLLCLCGDIQATVNCGTDGGSTTYEVNYNCTSPYGTCPADNSCPSQTYYGNGSTQGVNPDPCMYPASGGCPPFDGFRAGDFGDCCVDTSVTPVIIDMTGNGLTLTSLDDGVLFDFRGDGRKMRVSWTRPGADDAWLVLDRNGNGTIDNGTEMFGNITAQPASPHLNGFLALSEFDKPQKGGNGDGVIDKNDSVYSRLRLWRDANHDGVSQSEELSSLETGGLISIRLDYQDSKRVDANGNQYRYKARVTDKRNSTIGRWAYDVVLWSK